MRQLRKTEQYHVHVQRMSRDHILRWNLSGEGLVQAWRPLYKGRWSWLTVFLWGRGFLLFWGGGLKNTEHCLKFHCKILTKYSINRIAVFIQSFVKYCNVTFPVLQPLLPNLRLKFRLLLPQWSASVITLIEVSRHLSLAKLTFRDIRPASFREFSGWSVWSTGRSCAGLPRAPQRFLSTENENKKRVCYLPCRNKTANTCQTSRK